MAGLNIWRTSKPSSVGAPVEPMSKDDAEFWTLWRERRKAQHEERND